MPSLPLFPLQIRRGKRFLTDAQGRPFLVVGDTAWSLIVQLTPEEIDRYLDDRRRRGFNAILVNLIEHKFCSQPPRTRAGLAPFGKPDRFASPNPAYFDFAEQVVRKADAQGIVVFLCPAYLGYNGGDEGWFQEIRAGGRQAPHDYGRYLGERFRSHPNVVWTIGGDFTPPEADLWTVDALAAGIREGGAQQVMTGHGRPGQSAADAFPHREWLTLNATYSYDAALYRPLRADYQRRPVQPYLLLETTYENEHDARPAQIRRQAYWAMLCGACGQFLGNNPIWHFDGPGLFPAPMTWEKALEGTGSRDMTHLQSAFAGRAWHRLVPTAAAQIEGKDAEEVTTAVTPDGAFGMAYLPAMAAERITVTLPIGSCARPRTVQWFNPTSGSYTPCPGVDLSRDRWATFTTPGDNGTGTNDWLLIWEAN